MRQRKTNLFRSPPLAGHLARIASATVLVILSAACATADGARRDAYAGAAAAQPPLNADEACVSSAKIAELEREIEGLKAENTALIGRVLGIKSANVGESDGVFVEQSAPQALSAKTIALTEPRRSATASSTVTHGSTLYGAHLASYRALSSLQAGWRKLRRENPKELGGLEARVKKITVPQKGEFLRLIGGPISSKSEAESLCSVLESRDLSCRVVSFDGVPIIAGGAQEF